MFLTLTNHPFRCIFPKDNTLRFAPSLRHGTTVGEQKKTRDTTKNIHNNMAEERGRAPQLHVQDYDPLAPIPKDPLAPIASEIPKRSSSLSPAPKTATSRSTSPDDPAKRERKPSFNLSTWIQSAFKKESLQPESPPPLQRRLSVCEDDAHWQHAQSTKTIVDKTAADKPTETISDKRRKSISIIGSNTSSKVSTTPSHVESLLSSTDRMNIAKEALQGDTEIKELLKRSNHNQYGRFIHPTILLNDARLSADTSIEGDKPGVQKTFSSRRTIPNAHTGSGINDAILSVDGSIIASGGADNIVKIWDAESGQQLLKPLVGPHKQVLCLSLSNFSAERYLCLAASRDSGAYIFDLKSAKIKDILTGHAGSVHHAEFMLDSTKAATAGSDKTIRLWDLGRLKNYRTIATPSKCHAFAFYHDYTCVATAHNDSLRFWDLRSGDNTGEMLGHEDSSGFAEDIPITSVEVDSSGTKLVAACKDNLIRVIDVRMARVLLTLGAPGYEVGMNWANACFSPSANHVAAGGKDGAIYTWDIHREVFQARIPKHDAAVAKVHWMEGRMVSCSWDNSICVWYE